jgi:hypothetical protein
VKDVKEFRASFDTTDTDWVATETNNSAPTDSTRRNKWICD